MSDQSDSQNKSEEQVNLSEGTSPSSSNDEGSRSTPSNLPKAATRHRRKRNSKSEDEDYVAAEEEVSSKKKVVKKEFGTVASTKSGMHKKAPAERVPMSKARASTLETSKSTGGEAIGEGKKKKQRKRGRWCKKVDPMAEFEKHSSDEDEEEEDRKTTPKASAPAPKTAPKRSTRNIYIPAAEKNKAPVLETGVEEEDDAEAQVLRKLKPKIPDHDDNHPVAESMKVRKDAGLRLWRQCDPYAVRRMTAVDYRFHTKEQQDFYETILLDKKPIVCDMKWADWKYIDNNEDHFPGVHV
nr:transcriptional regulator ATRX homolog [Aegilops tauschii subsp. strangulata]